MKIQMTDTTPNNDRIVRKRLLKTVSKLYAMRSEIATEHSELLKPDEFPFSELVRGRLDAVHKVLVELDAHIEKTVEVVLREPST